MIFKKPFFLASVMSLAMVAGAFSYQAQAQSPSELLRLGLEESEADSSALPSGNAGARSPGLGLPQSSANPFAPEEKIIPKTPEEIEREIREQAFNAALTGLLPMKPDEIRTLLESFDETQQAVEVPVYPYPDASVVVETVSLDPGATPPVIKVGAGHVTTLTIMDVTGEPWPIHDVAFAGNFEVIAPGAGGHVVRITPTSEFAYGNISLQLLELKTPVTFSISTQRDEVHYRFDARIPEYGPFAQVPIMQGGLTLVAGNSVLSSVLDGIAPSGSEKLEVSGVDGRTTAYNFGDSTYLRTPLTLLSPSWSSSVSSADGMNVYELSNAPVVLLSDRGNVVRASLKEKGVSDE